MDHCHTGIATLPKSHNMEADSVPLPLLLSILRDRQNESPAMSAVNETNANLTMCKVLSAEEDYANIAAQLSPSDVRDMLDFMLSMICNGKLSSPDRRRARRLMFRILKRMPVMPRSLFVTGVSMPERRDYIASGGFGLVLKGKLQGKLIALKVLYKTRSDIDFCREALMWRSLNHKFVLSFIGIHEDESASQFFLVSPYMKNGTLAQWRKNAYPSIAEIEERMLEVAQGLEYIHSEGVVHGDLRGSNVLLDDDFHVQIADFGLTRISEATATNFKALSYNFAAPELFGQLKAGACDSGNVTIKTQMSDIYAFGCLYYQIHFDVVPFADRTKFQILYLVSKGERPPRLKEPLLDSRAWDMISLCWATNANERPGIEDITKCMMDADRRILRKKTKPIVSRRTAKIGFILFSVGLLLSIALFLSISNLARRSLIPPAKVRINVSCLGPLDTMQDWHMPAFRPRWLGYSWEPVVVKCRVPWGVYNYQVLVNEADECEITLVSRWAINVKLQPDDTSNLFRASLNLEDLGVGYFFPDQLNTISFAVFVGLEDKHKIGDSIATWRCAPQGDYGQALEREVHWKFSFGVVPIRKLYMEEILAGLPYDSGVIIGDVKVASAQANTILNVV